MKIWKYENMKMWKYENMKTWKWNLKYFIGLKDCNEFQK